MSSAPAQEPAGPPPMTMMGGSDTGIFDYAGWTNWAKGLITRRPS